MLNLTNASTDKLQLVTDTGADVDVVVSWVDWVSNTPTPGTTPTAITTATTTDIVATPAASTIRNVKHITARNKDSSLTQTLTVILDRNGTDYEIHKTILQPGECLEFIEGIGFFTLAAAYSRDQIRMVGSDSVHATAATWANVTDLQFSVISGKKYAYQCWLNHATNATTTGAQFGIGGVAMTEMMLEAIQEITASVTAAAYGSSAAVTAVDTAAVVETTGPGAVNMIAIQFGYFIPSATGTFSTRATSEVTVAGGLTVKKGSWARITEFDN
jgi:hypothetical protein